MKTSSQIYVGYLLLYLLAGQKLRTSSHSCHLSPLSVSLEPEINIFPVRLIGLGNTEDVQYYGNIISDLNCEGIPCSIVEDVQYFRRYHLCCEEYHSTIEDVQYCGKIPSVVWRNMEGVMEGYDQYCGEIPSGLSKVFSTVDAIP